MTQRTIERSLSPECVHLQQIPVRIEEDPRRQAALEKQKKRIQTELEKENKKNYKTSEMRLAALEQYTPKMRKMYRKFEKEFPIGTKVVWKSKNGDRNAMITGRLGDRWQKAGTPMVAIRLDGIADTRERARTVNITRLVKR